MKKMLLPFLVLCSFPAAAIEVTHSHQMCLFLDQHTPRADVAYQPGVDVHGKAVVPADLNGGDVLDWLTKSKSPYLSIWRRNLV